MDFEAWGYCIYISFSLRTPIYTSRSCDQGVLHYLPSNVLEEGIVFGLYSRTALVCFRAGEGLLVIAWVVRNVAAGHGPGKRARDNVVLQVGRSTSDAEGRRCSLWSVVKSPFPARQAIERQQREMEKEERLYSIFSRRSSSNSFERK
ncbi:uncharacterized protein [Physcomitrium patens]|uniref:uncharacterized protein n=1 Tax=Physcomitrium patens TaxID=3218 RepID=UPI003CCC933E